MIENVRQLLPSGMGLADRVKINQTRRSLTLDSHLTTYISQAVYNGRYLFIISGFPEIICGRFVFIISHRKDIEFS